ncbi:MAG: hypothetical protein E7352_04495 [Clostridiales bacterium]|nr:hypothetical protein [Clostridiales bacterium]
MEKSVVKYLAEFAERLDEGYGDCIDLGTLFADADNEKLNIADDLSWLDDFARVLDYIQRILGNEHLHVKHVQQVVKVQAASRLDLEGFVLTLKEPRFWKDSDRGPRPESVYMNTFEDEYAIYENRFIKMLIDEIIRYLSGTLTELAGLVGNLRTYFGSRLTAAGALRMSSEQENAVKNADDTRVLADGEDPIITVYDRVELLLKKAVKFKNSTLYRECQGKPLSGAIQPTNILTKNHAYRECYLFYKRFCAMRGRNKHLADALFDNGVLRMLYAIYCGGYRIVGKPTVIRLADGSRAYDKVCMQKDVFTIELRTVGKAELLVTTSMRRDRAVDTDENAEETAKRYTSRVIVKVVDCEAEESGALATAYRREKLAQGYEDAYIAVCSRKATESDGVINLANKGDFGCRATEDFVRSLTMQLAGAHKIFGKRCPVCGAKCVDTGESLLSCMTCESAWSLVREGGVDKVWVKRIRH